MGDLGFFNNRNNVRLFYKMLVHPTVQTFAQFTYKIVLLSAEFVFQIKFSGWPAMGKNELIAWKPNFLVLGLAPKCLTILVIVCIVKILTTWLSNYA